MNEEKKSKEPEYIYRKYRQKWHLDLSQEC